MGDGMQSAVRAPDPVRCEQGRLLLGCANTNTAMPYTRFQHGACHTAPASVPLPQSSYTFTWNTIAGYAQIHNQDNPVQTAPALTSQSAQLFPYVRQGPIDTTGGHHDAGDYSKYTINCARLVHLLMFQVDSLAGVGDVVPLRRRRWRGRPRRSTEHLGHKVGDQNPPLLGLL